MPTEKKVGAPWLS